MAKVFFSWWEILPPVSGRSRRAGAAADLDHQGRKGVGLNRHRHLAHGCPPADRIGVAYQRRLAERTRSDGRVDRPGRFRISGGGDRRDRAAFRVFHRSEQALLRSRESWNSKCRSGPPSWPKSIPPCRKRSASTSGGRGGAGGTTASARIAGDVRTRPAVGGL